MQLSKRTDLKYIFAQATKKVCKTKTALKEFEIATTNAQKNYQELKQLEEKLKETKIAQLLENYPIFNSAITESDMNEIRYISLAAFITYPIQIFLKIKQLKELN